LIARNSNAIDPLSRTLKVEVDIDNPRTLLLPGAYVFVHAIACRFSVTHHSFERAALPSRRLARGRDS
jgi:hypothetical protein